MCNITKKMNIWIKYLHRPYQAGVAKGKKYSCIVSEILKSRIYMQKIKKKSTESSRNFEICQKRDLTYIISTV